MNWYTIAQLQNFEDRNIWNDRIDDLKNIAVELNHLSKLVYQTGKLTKERLGEIMKSKRINPYPDIEKSLEEAERLCLDSPHKVSAILNHAVDEVAKRVKGLEKQRRDFIHRDIPSRTKYKGSLNE